MLEIKFLGPPLEAGPLPAVFYFALSANDSLYTDPFNQPAQLLANAGLRVFTATLPGHDTLPPTEALRLWADEIRKGNDFIDKFTTQAAAYIEMLFEKNIVPAGKLAVMGLSRGVFIAAHVAAKVPQIQTLLGFAPLTQLKGAEEFQGLDVDKWNLTHLADKLYNRTVRCYIGNHDTRVGTDHCFEFISTLADTAADRQLRSSPIELIIGPSIGRYGHGTSPEVFRQGTDWVISKLEAP
jgi:hypothetical protein